MTAPPSAGASPVLSTSETTAEPAADAVYDPAIDPVLCSPFQPPHQYWRLDRIGRAVSGREPAKGRRPSMLLNPAPADEKSDQMLLRLEDVRANTLINEIRDKVSAWRASGYLGATAVSVRLLEHWADERGCRRRPFFAQREAIETLVWLREVATRQTPERRELEALSREHNDQIVRHAVKMATGTGKTAVMGMLIAWQTLNAARTTRSRNLMHAERFVVLTPGVTIRSRLAELKPSNRPNVYDEMGLVPADLRRTLNRARVEVVNFQAFNRQDLNSLGFPRSGAKGNRAHRDLIGRAPGDAHLETHAQVTQRVLKSLLSSDVYGDVVVINDEAHHCYLPKTTRRSRDDARSDKHAAVWFNVMRSLRDEGHLGTITDGYGQASVVYDFSATPMWINTSARTEPEPFEWVASDFGLMDAIESGLTKVPRVPVDDDSTQHRTVWRNLYANTDKRTIPQPSKDGSGCEIPAPLRNALDAQYDDYKTHLTRWTQARPHTAPVLIVVANSIDNANALYEHIAGWAEEHHNDQPSTLHPGMYPELSNIVAGDWTTEPRTLVVHSDIDESDEISANAKKMLKAQGERLTARSRATAKDALSAVREVLNTVGQEGRPGAKVRCVISVGMLTEGWDARNVTHIVGYRAFSTQLLCEQVTGRALRRTSYEDFHEDGSGRLMPEYAEVVGIPFEFMPSKPTKPISHEVRPRTRVHTVAGRSRYRIVWPQISEYKRISETTSLKLDPARVQPWLMRPLSDPSMTLLKSHVGESKLIHTQHRSTKSQFKLAEMIVQQFRSTNPDTEAANAALFVSARRAVREWLAQPSVECPVPADLLVDNEQRRSAAAAIIDACSDHRHNTHPRMALLGTPPTVDTAAVDFATTLRHIHTATRSELSHAACHSLLEKDIAEILDTHRGVVAWARNFQTAWSVPYWFASGWRRYEPDFVARLANGVNLIIECKGVPDDKSGTAESYVRDHWIPCATGTLELPDALRVWDYVVITDAGHAAYQINTAAKTAPVPTPPGAHP